MKLSTVLILALACGASQQAFTHGGGLNSEGCHNNGKTGDYHCHRAPVRKQAVALTAPPRATATAPGRPQCFTGPRGGTYTITASGRKNYSGC